MSERSGYIPELQSIRGLAALSVAIGHSLAFYRQPDDWRYFSLLFNGRMAVVLFFVLSGFVLTRALKGAGLERANVASYGLRRLLRIYPAIWVVSLFSLAYVDLIHWRWPHPSGMSPYYLTRFSRDNMRSIYLAASFGGALAYLIPQLWSVFVEILASAAMPLIAFAAWRRRSFFYAQSGLALLASFTIGEQTYYHVGLYAFDFFAGAWLATAEPGARRAMAQLAPLSGPLAVLLTLMAVTSQFLPLSYYSPLAALYEAAVATLLIALIVYGGAQIRLLQHPWTVWLGDVSYSVYLAHYLLACLMVYALAAAQSALNIELSSELRAGVLAVLVVCATLLISPLLYAWVESPGIALGKRWSRRLGSSLGGETVSRAKDALQAESTPP